MHIRAIDSGNDWQFGKGLQSYKYKNDAIMQNIKTRLLSFLNNCFFDMDAGIDWWRLLGSKNTQEEIKIKVKEMILQSYGVLSCSDVQATFTSSSRSLILSYTIKTIYSSEASETVEV